jgi:hypothetical protein
MSLPDAGKGGLFWVKLRLDSSVEVHAGRKGCICLVVLYDGVHGPAPMSSLAHHLWRHDEASASTLATASTADVPS